MLCRHAVEGAEQPANLAHVVRVCANDLAQGMVERVLGGGRQAGHRAGTVALIGTVRHAVRDEDGLVEVRVVQGIAGVAEPVERSAAAGLVMRSEEPSGGKECVSTCRYRGWPSH